MNGQDATLAVLLRRGQWLLDELAYDLPAGRCTSEDREAVAQALDELAGALRGQQVAPRVVDADLV